MDKKGELIKRWQSVEGQQLKNEILKALNSGVPFEKMKGIEKVSGRWDLRGIKFAENPKIERVRSYEMIKNSIIFKNYTFDNIDFTFADLSYTFWEHCTFNGNVFVETKLKGIKVTRCYFSNIDFIQCNLSDSFLNFNSGSDSGYFRHVNFIESDLSKASFDFPIIEDCKFINSNLFETNFDGSRFRNCVFEGELDSTFYRGYSIYAQKSILGIFKRINPQDYPNKMEDVDFSGAKLVGVMFSHSIDLSKCKFPDDEKLFSS